MKRRTTTWIWTALAATLTLTLAAPADARPAPVRSGTIVSGVLTTSPAWNCQLLPDCRAWLESGCNPALSGRDPAWLTSIVDVAGIADGRTPFVFQVTRAAPAGAVLGGVTIQFWTAGCTEIRGSTWSTFLSAPTWSNQLRKVLAVPARARWMTVAGNDNVNLRWTLS